MKIQRKSDLFWIFAAILMAALLGWSAFQTHAIKQQGIVFPRDHMEIARADGTKAAFRIEVATTPDQQERGLMFRKRLSADAGMLFIWSEDQLVSMWMKNTEIPLDMLFIDHTGRIVKIAANAVPHDLTSLTSDVVVHGVLEIGGGESERQNIKVGDRILYPTFVEQK